MSFSLIALDFSEIILPSDVHVVVAFCVLICCGFFGQHLPFS